MYAFIISLRFMEIDKEWETGRCYMEMREQNQLPQEDYPLLEGIK